MKFFLICFAILLVFINTTVTKGEENEILGNFEDFALSINSKYSNNRNYNLR